VINCVRGDGVGRVIVIIISITVIGHISRKLSLTLSATLTVNCINGCDGGLLEVGAVVWDQWEAPITIFSVFSIFVVVGFGSVSIIIGKLSLSSSAMSAVGCSSGGGLLRVKAVASDWHVAQVLSFLVFSAFSVAGIVIRSIVTGIIIEKLSLTSLTASAMKLWHGCCVTECEGSGVVVVGVTDHHCISVCGCCGHCHC